MLVRKSLVKCKQEIIRRLVLGMWLYIRRWWVEPAPDFLQQLVLM